MQEKEYAQVYEMGLGSLIGDFFQNVKDTVSGVAKAVAPVAPFILPFTGLGPLAQLGIGAGLGIASGQKPADVAKNLAIQTALTGITGGFKGTGAKTPINTGTPTVSDQNQALLDFFDEKIPGIKKSGIEQIKADPSFFETATGKTKDFFTKGIGARLNPFSDASRENPLFRKYVDEYGMDPVDVLKLGIKPERGFVGQVAPAVTLASSLLPLAMRKPEVDDTDYVGQARDDFYISYAADGGEMTGGIANTGKKIEHPNGKVKEHPKRIGEIAGKGTGTSDDIPAMLSDGEFVMTAQAVRNAGGGSRKAGAQNMYKLMKNLEKGGTLSTQSLGMVGRA